MVSNIDRTAAVLAGPTGRAVSGSLAVAFTRSCAASRVIAVDDLGHAGRLRGVADLEGDVEGDLDTVVRRLLDGRDGHAHAEVGAARKRGGEANLVAAVVEAEADALHREDLLHQARDEG